MALEADHGDGAPSEAAEPIPILLEDDIIAAIIHKAESTLTLRLLSRKLCGLLMLGSKRRPLCLTRTLRASVTWDTTELRAEVVNPKESKKSVKETRNLVCKRLSNHLAADIVPVYEKYRDDTSHLKYVTLLTQCRAAKVPKPATVRHWVGDFMTFLGYSKDVRITPYMLIKSRATAQLCAQGDAESIANHRWDSATTIFVGNWSVYYVPKVFLCQKFLLVLRLHFRQATVVQIF
ncbi:hypothetical protein DFS34DRAFT_590443 [Phlyctochytrium arcticum]|nr:hypothetical protein DFS34DRAFT_590443 [Phlyctochytrium arcticum]